MYFPLATHIENVKFGTFQKVKKTSCGHSLIEPSPIDASSDYQSYCIYKAYTIQPHYTL